MAKNAKSDNGPHPIIRCTYSSIAKIKDLKLNPENRNVHPQEQIKRLADILKYQGFRYCVKVSKQSGFVTSGHGRVEAALTNGWSEVPVDDQDYDTPEQEYADTIADNAIASWSELNLAGIHQDIQLHGPELNIEMLGMKDFKIEPADKLDPQCDEDEVPEVKESFVKLGDIWQLGRHRLVCGDSTSVEVVDLLMDRDSVDMVFTDPPYGMSAVSKSGVLSKSYSRGDILNDDNVDVAKDAYRMCAGMAIPKMVFWGANYYSSALPDASCWLVWDKNNDQSDQMDCELAWTNFKGVTRQFTQASEKKNRVHPTQKPVSLIEWCLNRWEAGNVLDLFGGSGSTLIACEKTNRKSFIIELDPHYCAVIVERWQAFTGKKAERLDG